MQQNGKISTSEKTPNFPNLKLEKPIIKINKFLLKRSKICHIFLANVSKRKYIKYWDVKRTVMWKLLCRLYYFQRIVSIT